MAWISFLFLVSIQVFAAELPKFLTKHSADSLRFISMDGRYAYVQKRPGVLGFVSSFRSVDFLSDSSQSEFLVSSSRFRTRLAIETVPNAHTELNLLKENKISVVEWGNTNTKEIGSGQNAQLHLQDEWITFFRPYEKSVVIQNIVTQKKFEIKLSPKSNPFFIPDVEMISSDTIVYTDINEKGYSALISYNLLTQKSNVLYKSPLTGTRMELCQDEGYLAVGEFPYDSLKRGSKISQIKLNASSNLAGLNTLYSSVDQDLGNMVCLSNSLYFIKTMKQNEKLNIKVTEAVKLDLKTNKVEAKTTLNHVTQLIEMDGRVMIPLRGEFFVLEGSASLIDDSLKAVPVNSNEELPLDI